MTAGVCTFFGMHEAEECACIKDPSGRYPSPHTVFCLYTCSEAEKYAADHGTAVYSAAGRAADSRTEPAPSAGTGKNTGAVRQSLMCRYPDEDMWYSHALSPAAQDDGLLTAVLTVMSSENGRDAKAHPYVFVPWYPAADGWYAAIISEFMSPICRSVYGRIPLFSADGKEELAEFCGEHPDCSVFIFSHGYFRRKDADALAGAAVPEGIPYTFVYGGGQ